MSRHLPSPYQGSLKNCFYGVSRFLCGLVRRRFVQAAVVEDRDPKLVNVYWTFTLQFLTAVDIKQDGEYVCSGSVHGLRKFSIQFPGLIL